MVNLCSNCAKSHQLMRLIQEIGTKVRKCQICGGIDIKAVDCESNDLTQLFKALIRYHFSEWDYNTHFGGSCIESLFFQENPILNYNERIKEELLEEAILTLIANVYEKYDSGVSLYAGYGENGDQNFLLRSIKTDFDNRLKSVNSALTEMNYFLIENQGIELVNQYLPKLEIFINTSSEYHRARIGYEEDVSPFWGWGEEREYRPYSEHAISSPPPQNAKSGRMNREGVSFLYLATDSETAIAETRPHPGQKISLGKFTNLEKIRVRLQT